MKAEIVLFLKKWFATLGQNLNRTTTVIRISNGLTISTYFLSTLWTLILGVSFAVVVGSIGALVVSAGVLSYQYLFYRFRFKSVVPSGTWHDYLEYRAKPDTYAIETRSGTLLVSDMLSALDAAQVNPLLGFIQSYCFREPGVYKINLARWSDAIKSLNKLGLIKWFVLNGKSIGLVSLEAFLLAAFHFSNLSFRLPVIGTVEIGIHELSRTKLIFNICALLSVMISSSLFVGSALIYLILTRLGFIGLGTRAGQYASSFYVASMSTLSLFLVGQFVPPHCESLAEYLEDVPVVNGKIPIALSQLENNDVIFYVPPKEIEFVDIPVDSSGIEIPTVGSLEGPHFHGNLRRRQTKHFREIQELFEDSDVNPLSCPSDAPIFERMKETVKTIENEFPLE